VWRNIVGFDLTLNVGFNALQINGANEKGRKKGDIRETGALYLHSEWRLAKKRSV
jgi:hypothetical protein